MSDCDIGIFGLAVMGQNLVLNMADHGFKVAVYNRTEAKTEEFMAGEAGEKSIDAAYEVDDFIALLKKPRVVLLIVKAGDAVDAVIEQLAPYLESGDIIIDGGNSYFKDTERRAVALAEQGIQFVGMGVSGGEEGARHGPSMMPGGSPASYERIKPIVEKVAAKANGEPCVAYLGPRGAGHYVKMVHNGIEYAIMQAIAEVYDILSRSVGLKPAEISEIFRRWNEAILSSFLMEISWKILAFEDIESGQPLVNLIADRAKQKGTGKWTTQDALDLGVSVPTITAAVEARTISALKEEREHAATILRGPKADYSGEKAPLIDALEQALLSTVICAYAQGFSAMNFASEEYNYDLDFAVIAKIWREGCIIRARLLDDISGAFKENNSLPNLIIAPYFAKLLNESQPAWRYAVQTAVGCGIPIPALSSALMYVDSYRSARLPANLIQAQRDFFGAHTYERLDQEGTFHTEWAEGE